MVELNAPRTRIALALIPGDPHFSAIIKASTAITASYENHNIIDELEFPPHVSLLICTVSSEHLDALRERIGESLPSTACSELMYFHRLRKGASGYITMDLTITETLADLREWALRTVSTAGGNGESGSQDKIAGERPEHLEMHRPFIPHYSVAKVHPTDQNDAYQIASEALSGVGPAPISAIEVCDIGMRSEKWDVIYRLE